MAGWNVKYITDIFYLQTISKKKIIEPHLKRESSNTSTLLTRSKTHLQAHLSQALASPAKLWPAQIVLPHRLGHTALPPRSRAGQASFFFSLLPQCRRHLDQSLASRSRRHHPRPISFSTHPRTILSPSQKIVATAKDQSLFPDLSLFPSISQSLSLISIFFLLLLWWCGWWCFGGFCVVWWWVLCE